MNISTHISVATNAQYARPRLGAWTGYATLRTIVLALLLAAVAPDAYAYACSQPKLTGSVGPVAADGTFTLTVTQASLNAGQQYRIYWRGGTILKSGHLGTVTTQSLSLACMVSDSQLRVVPLDCYNDEYLPGSWSTTVGALYKPPSVAVSFKADEAGGPGTLTVPYKFPYANSRSLTLYVDGVWKGGPPSSELKTEGVWTTALDTTCWTPGAHEIKVVARSCDGTGPSYNTEARTTINVDVKPVVSLSASETSPEGGVTFTVPYAFPNTGARRLDLLLDGAVVASATTGLAREGTWTHSLSAARCWKNAKVIATACGKTGVKDYTAEAQTPSDNKDPWLEVTLRKALDPTKGRFEAVVSYDLGENVATRSVTIERLSWTDADGVVHAASGVIAKRDASAPLSDSNWIVPFDPPSGARHVRLLATAQACGRATQTPSIDCGCDGTDDPVYFADGNVRVTDTDPLPAIAGHVLTRTYDSDEQVAGHFGRGFTTLFEQRLMRDTREGTEVVSIVTPTNDVVTFSGVNGSYRQTYPTSQANPGTLTYDAAAGTYAYRAGGGSEVAVFRATDGKLVALQDRRTGREARIAYSASALPETVTDSWTGTKWQLAFSGRQVVSIAINGEPAQTWTYAYDANRNLTAVRAPGSNLWRSYEYVANRMTASRDALGNLIEKHAYDAKGYGINSTGPSDEVQSIEYNLPGEAPNEVLTRVTMQTGAVMNYYLRPAGGGYRVARVVGGCASCGGGDAVYARDAGGRIVREQDARGYITSYEYDSAQRVISTTTHSKPFGCDPETDPGRCRLSPEELLAADRESDDLASPGPGLEATRATVKTSFEYGDPNWPNSPTAVLTGSSDYFPLLRTPGTAGRSPAAQEAPQQKRETRAYDASTGKLMMRSVSGYTGAGPVYETRTTVTTLYNGTEGAVFAPGGTFDAAWAVLPQPRGETKQIDGPRSDVEDKTSFVYYPVDPSVPALLRGHPAAMRNAAGHVTRYEAYDVFGQATRVIDPNGVVTEREFDALGRPTKTTIKGVPGCDTAADPLCATAITATLAYSGAGPLLRETTARGAVATYSYDDRGRISTISRGPSETDLREQIEVTYDAATGRRAVERTLAREGTSWVEKRRVTNSYDSLRRLQTVTHADGSSIAYTYTPSNQIATVRDENHATANTTYAYDPAGRLEVVTQTLAGAADGVIVTRYAYDAEGRLTGVTDPNGNITSYWYDDFGQMQWQNSPVTGMTTYTYDLAAQLIATVDANGAETTRTYDALGRPLTAVSTAPGAASETVAWTYDNGTAGRFGIGRVASMTDPAGTTVYSYERRGLLREEVRTFTASATPYTTRFTYDADGNRASIAYPSNALTVAYTHDFAGRPVTASGAITSATYLPFGPLSELRFANGTTQRFEHDNRYRLTKNQLTVDAAPGNTALARYTYDYDPVGNITGIKDTLDSEYHRHFAYDELNRLVTANTGPVANPNRPQGTALWGKGSYTWDAMGNLLSVQLGEIPKDDTMEQRARPKPPTTEANVPRGRTSLFTYAGTTPLIDTVTTNDLTHTVSHDPAGNETSYYVARTYSPRNLLANVSDKDVEALVPHTVAYSYDGRGVRVTRAESPSNGPGTIARRYYLYSPDLRLLSATRDDAPNVWGGAPPSTAANNVDHEIVWFGDRPVAQVHPGLGTRFTFADHLGTPILQTDATATVVWQVEYEPFGNVYAVREGNRTEQPLRFPGQELAMTWEGPEENYNVFRWYKGGWGRYTQADPIGLKGGPNLFGYVFGNPIRLTDPYGLKVRTCCKIIPGTAEASAAVLGASYAAGTPIYIAPKRHCYFEFGDGTTIGLSGVESGAGIPSAVAGTAQGTVVFAPPGSGAFEQRTDVTTSGCGPWSECADSCVWVAAKAYPSPSKYQLLGPNSNTFAGTIERKCPVAPPPPTDVMNAPGWYDSPPQ